MKVLVTGGAGYIGSQFVRNFAAKEHHHPIVYDNLVYGHKEAVKSVPSFYEGDIIEKTRLSDVLKKEKVDVVVHFAAYAYVGESVENPRKYYQNNLCGTVSLLDAMIDSGVNKIIFSSSCSTYGMPREEYITEEHVQNPINPYGMSKLMVERILADYKKAYGFRYTILRYFNAAGADPSGEIGEDHKPETHLIPNVFKVALGQSGSVDLFGTDYDTPDRTCIRDYIHVWDLAEAHILAMKYLEQDGGISEFNLGIGKGYSVNEVIDSIRTVTNIDIPVKIKPRRPGDPDRLVASNRKAKQVLGWVPKYAGIDEIVQSAWKWHSSHPDGFSGEK